MDPEEIIDRQTLRAWLKTRSREEDSVVMGHRSALRVFPIYASAMGTTQAREGNLTALTILRGLLISRALDQYSAYVAKVAADHTPTRQRPRWPTSLRAPPMPATRHTPPSAMAQTEP